MKFLKILLLSTLTLFFIAIGAYYLYVKSLPTLPPVFVNSSDLGKNQKDAHFSCALKGGFNYAYSVKVNVESKLNDQIIYHSNLSFKTQLNQANGDIIKGVATDITIDEGKGSQGVEDVYYLSRVGGDHYAYFSAYNHLGLMKQHPMSILSQLLKVLSVGEEGEAYLFTYDPLQRTYRYKHTANEVVRASYPSTASTQHLTNLFGEYKNQWSVILGDDCVPQSAVSEESEGIAASGHGGYIKFRIEASKIPSYTKIEDDKHNAQTNAGLSWGVKGVNESEFEDAVTSREQMWQILSDFLRTKNTSQLVKAAQYMIDNITASELSEVLLDTELADTIKRELIFGLGISQRAEAEEYLIATMSALPIAAGNIVDLQKVRVMVAMSGNAKASDQSFRFLEQVLGNSEETANIQGNALINMGSLVTQLKNNGQLVPDLDGALSKVIEEQLDTQNAAAAMLAAGNAQVQGLDEAFKKKLSSSSSRERYAAGTILSRKAEHYDGLIQHIVDEPSNLVINAIISNLDVRKLSTQQQAKLLILAEHSADDKADVIQAVLVKAELLKAGA